MYGIGNKRKEGKRELANREEGKKNKKDVAHHGMKWKEMRRVETKIV